MIPAWFWFMLGVIVGGLIEWGFSMIKKRNENINSRKIPSWTTNSWRWIISLV